MKLLILDCDGVFTSGKNYRYVDGPPQYIVGVRISGEKELVVSKNFRDTDWTACKLFKTKDVHVHVLTGDKWNHQVFADRKIPHTIIDGKLEKENFLDALLIHYGVTKDECGYLADDIFDLRLMRKVNEAYCPSDANPFVREYLDSRYYEEMTGNTLTLEDYKDREVCRLLSTNPYVLETKGGDGCVMELYHHLYGKDGLSDEDIDKLILINAEGKNEV